MFDATGTAASSQPSPPRDGSRARRLQWSLVIGLALGAVTWMGWQYWQSTQAPGLTPTEGTQPTPGAVQGEVIVSQASEDAASQAASQTEAQANVHPKSNILVGCLGTERDPPMDTHHIDQLGVGEGK